MKAKILTIEDWERSKAKRKGEGQGHSYDFDEIERLERELLFRRNRDEYAEIEQKALEKRLGKKGGNVL